MRRWVSLTGLARVCFFTAFVTSTGCSWIYGEDGLFPDNTARYQEAPELAVITVPPSAGTGEAAGDPTLPNPGAGSSSHPTPPAEEEERCTGGASLESVTKNEKMMQHVLRTQVVSL